MAKKQFGYDLGEALANAVNAVDEMIFGGEIFDGKDNVTESDDNGPRQSGSKRVGNTFIADETKRKKKPPATGGGSGAPSGGMASKKDDSSADDQEGDEPDGSQDTAGK